MIIAIELDKEHRHGWWVLSKSTKENAKLSDQELSANLLKPIPGAAGISRDAESVAEFRVRDLF
jgi:hypothetical protein